MKRFIFLVGISLVYLMTFSQLSFAVDKKLLKSARKGDERAVLMLAQAYEKEGNYSEAFRWFLQSAEKKT